MGAAVTRGAHEGETTNRSFQHIGNLESPSALHQRGYGAPTEVSDAGSNNIRKKKRGSPNQVSPLAINDKSHLQRPPPIPIQTEIDIDVDNEYVSDEEEDAEEGYESATELDTALHLYSDKRIRESSIEPTVVKNGVTTHTHNVLPALSQRIYDVSI